MLRFRGDKAHSDASGGTPGLSKFRCRSLLFPSLEHVISLQPVVKVVYSIAMNMKFTAMMV